MNTHSQDPKWQQKADAHQSARYHGIDSGDGNSGVSMFIWEGEERGFIPFVRGALVCRMIYPDITGLTMLLGNQYEAQTTLEAQRTKGRTPGRCYTKINFPDTEEFPLTLTLTCPHCQTSYKIFRSDWVVELGKPAFFLVAKIQNRDKFVFPDKAGFDIAYVGTKAGYLKQLEDEKPSLVIMGIFTAILALFFFGFSQFIKSRNDQKRQLDEQQALTNKVPATADNSLEAVTLEAEKKTR